ncbi:MAG TPA: polymer-forming cytoskeletal protein [Pseudomonadota bacterium]|nr:polymer-forming cytoskeletal protein [Pseudomonadota bacterium]
MAQTKTTIGAGTKIVGQVTSEEDLTVEGRLEGGPLRVRGRLTVAKGGEVHCEDTEVGDALVVGLFEGTLRAREVVRIHKNGQLLGEVMAARVTFVSDHAPVTASSAVAAPPPAPPPAAPPPAAPPAEVVSEQSSDTATMAMPHAEPPPAPPASESSARAIPALPSLGARAMQRKD